MTDTINLRLKSKGCSITATPDPEAHGITMRDDVRSLAKEWLQQLQLGLKPESVEASDCEFILQSTLDYIEALEGVLEHLLADTDTTDEVLTMIEGVLK
jgi:hypothetical protein